MLPPPPDARPPGTGAPTLPGLDGLGPSPDDLARARLGCGGGGRRGGICGRCGRPALRVLLGAGDEKNARGRHHDGHDHEEEAVVEHGDECSPEGDRDRLRRGHEDTDGGRDTALQLVRRAALHECREGHDEPRQTEAEQGDPGSDEEERARHLESAAATGEDEGGSHREALADAADEPGGGHAAEDRADALDGDEDAEEARPPVEPVRDDRETERLEEADHHAGESRRRHHLAEHDVAPDVHGAGGDRVPPASVLRHRRRLVHPDEEERSRRHDEGAGVDHGDHAPARHREDGGADERAEEADPLAGGRQEAVGVGETVGRHHRGEEGGLARIEERRHDAVEEGDEPDDPDLAAAVDGEKAEHDGGAGEVAPHEDRSAVHAVDDDAGERPAQRGEREEEEGEAGLGVGPGELADPDAHGEPGRGVAEDREELAAEEPAEVAVGEDGLHDSASLESRAPTSASPSSGPPEASPGSGARAAASASRRPFSFTESTADTERAAAKAPIAQWEDTWATSAPDTSGARAARAVATCMRELVTRACSSGGVRRSMTAMSAALPVGERNSGRAMGRATSGLGTTRAATTKQSAPPPVRRARSAESERRPCIFGAAIAPSRPPAMTPAWVSPMTVGDTPWWRSATTTVKIIPLKAKLMSGACTTTARMSESCQTKRMPSKASRHRPFRSADAFARKFPLIPADVSSEAP